MLSGQETLRRLETFLFVLAKPSVVSIPVLISSFTVVSKISMDKNYAKYLLDKTRRDYNLIAEDFSRSRDKLWEELRFLEKYVADSERVLDLGCGNGRLYELFRKKNVDYYGIDISEKLIEIAKKRYPQAKFWAVDALNLPFFDNFFDKVISIAVFHHVPSKELRARFLGEVKRVLKPGGTFILIVWNLNSFKKSLIFVKYGLGKILRRSNLDFGDAFLPWGEEILRYVHRFSKKELIKLLGENDFKVEKINILARENSKESNILVVAKKAPIAPNKSPRDYTG